MLLFCPSWSCTIICCINWFTSLCKTVKHWKWCTWHRKASAKNSSKLKKFLHSEVNQLIQHKGVYFEWQTNECRKSSKLESRGENKKRKPRECWIDEMKTIILRKGLTEKNPVETKDRPLWGEGKPLCSEIFLNRNGVLTYIYWFVQVHLVYFFFRNVYFFVLQF